MTTDHRQLAQSNIKALIEFKHAVTAVV